jgi:hypothetical protein
MVSGIYTALAMKMPIICRQKYYFEVSSIARRDVNIMDKINEFITIAEEKIGIILTKRLFCILLLLFEIDRKVIVEKLGVSLTTVKKFGALIGSGNMRDIFADTVYRRRSEMEDFREQIMAELDKKPART